MDLSAWSHVVAVILPSVINPSKLSSWPPWWPQQATFKHVTRNTRTVYIFRWPNRVVSIYQMSRLSFLKNKTKIHFQLWTSNVQVAALHQSILRKIIFYPNHNKFSKSHSQSVSVFKTNFLPISPDQLCLKYIQSQSVEFCWWILTIYLLIKSSLS